MFYVKKLISQFLYPMPLNLTLIGIGLYLLWATTRQKAGKIIISVAFGLLTIQSYGVLDNLLELLEQRYPCYRIHDSSAEYIVVLGGGRAADDRLSITHQLSQAAIARLMEGIRIYTHQPGSKLVFSGEKTGEAMAKSAVALGVNEHDIIFDNHAKDTREEAETISKLIGKKPVILVTSASHLERAMGLFKAYGMVPYPAPADFHIRKDPEIFVTDFFPKTIRLLRAEIAIHEYAGIAWNKISR